MIPYNNVASDYLQTRYFTNDPITANVAMSIPDTLAMVLIPIMGHYVDRLGRKMSLIALGAACFIVGHGMLALGGAGGICLLALITLGFAYATLLAFWACVPRLVRFVRHSTAYGVLTSACNLSVTVVSLLVAPLVARDPSYRTAGLFFAGLGLTSLLLVFLLSSINLHRRLGLNTPASVQVHGALTAPALGAAPLLLVAEVSAVVKGREGSPSCLEEDSGHRGPSRLSCRGKHRYCWWCRDRTTEQLFIPVKGVRRGTGRVTRARLQRRHEHTRPRHEPHQQHRARWDCLLLSASSGIVRGRRLLIRGWDLSCSQ